MVSGVRSIPFLSSNANRYKSSEGRVAEWFFNGEHLLVVVVFSQKGRGGDKKLRVASRVVARDFFFSRYETRKRVNAYKQPSIAVKSSERRCYILVHHFSFFLLFFHAHAREKPPILFRNIWTEHWSLVGLMFFQRCPRIHSPFLRLKIKSRNDRSFVLDGSATSRRFVSRGVNRDNTFSKSRKNILAEYHAYNSYVILRNKKNTINFTAN